MKVFISWSGDTSHELALVLHDWLPDVLQSVKPWVSSEDISKGQFWLPELTAALQESKFGICCLTPENVSSPWMAFEAGAMVAYQKAKERVAPVLLGLKPTDAIGPYGSLQHAQFTVEDFTKLLLSINAVSESPIDKERVERAVKSHWPALSTKATAINAKAKSADVQKVRRSEGEVLEELLELLRSQGNMLSQLVFRQGVSSTGYGGFGGIGNIGSYGRLSTLASPQAARTLGSYMPSYVNAGGSLLDVEVPGTSGGAGTATAASAKGSGPAKPADDKKK